jgi:DNA-binding CsgD family transcriptional regulator
VDFSEQITPENVQRMGEVMALMAFKPFLSYADSALGKLYEGLIKDINRKDAAGHTFSDGYDFAQDAICFLCGHIGKTMDTVLGTDRRGKILTVKLACFRTITKSLNKRLTNHVRNVCIDKVYEPKTATQFESDIVNDMPEEDYTAVNETIAKLNLTTKQRNALLSLMDTNSYSESARVLSINRGTVWVLIMRVREKYIRIFSEPKLRMRR